MNPRAITYRKLNDIPHDLGTAVNVQTMVFGNMGDTSATGVGFTRNPSTGAKEFYGEFLQNAQGEDVVSGVRTPHPIADLEKRDADGVQAAARDHDPARAALQGRAGLRVHDPGEHALHAPDPQRQADGARRGQHRGRHVRGGADHEEGSAAEGRAAGARPAAAPDLRPEGAARASRSRPRACPASPGAATGAIVFTADDAVAWAQKGKQVLLVRMETVPGRHPRHVGRAGHPHRHRRHDVARRRRRPADGQALGRRLRRARHQRQGQDAEGRRARRSRKATRSRSTARPARSCWPRCRRAPPR